MASDSNAVVVPLPGMPANSTLPCSGSHLKGYWHCRLGSSARANATPASLTATSAASESSATVGGRGSGQGRRRGEPPQQSQAAFAAAASRARSLGVPISQTASGSGAGMPSGAGTTRGPRRPAVTPVTRAHWNSTSSPGPRRANARPGRCRPIAAASGLSSTSTESAASSTRRAMRSAVLVRMLALTAPAGRWVANTRCMPRLRPRWATLTRASMNPGSSAARAANSSMITTSRASGGRSSPRASRASVL